MWFFFFVYFRYLPIIRYILCKYLLLLSCFSRVRLCATLEMAAHQAPPSVGFSRQEYCSGLPFPSPTHERKSESEVAQLCQTLSDSMDCSLPGSSAHGIFQARVLEWGAIASSGAFLTHPYISPDSDLLTPIPTCTTAFCWSLPFL